MPPPSPQDGKAIIPKQAVHSRNRAPPTSFGVRIDDLNRRLTLANDEEPIGRQSLVDLLSSPGPADHEAFDTGGAAKAEVKTGVIDRQVAGSAAAGPPLLETASDNPHPGAYSSAVQSLADELYLDPMSHGGPRVSKKLGAPPGITDDNVDIAVIVEIAEGRSAAHLASPERLPARRRAIFKATIPAVAVEPVALFVAGRIDDVAGEGIEMPVGHIDVLPAIEIEIEKARSPGDLGKAA